MRGKFIVCEGTDGSGKATQARLLAERLQDEGVKVSYFDFPQYDKSFFGKLVGRFLKESNLGSRRNIDVYLSALPYALDRWQAAPDIRRALDEGSWAISSRYALSSAAHQTARLPENEREAFVNWLEELEYTQLGIPKEDRYLYLYVPSDIGQKLVDQKGERGYMAGNGRDILESNLEHQQTAASMYKYLAEKYPHITTINCCNEGGSLMSIPDIHSVVWAETLSLYGREINEARIRRERE